MYPVPLDGITLLAPRSSAHEARSCGRLCQLVLLFSRNLCVHHAPTKAPSCEREISRTDLIMGRAIWRSLAGTFLLLMLDVSFLVQRRREAGRIAHVHVIRVYDFFPKPALEIFFFYLLSPSKPEKIIRILWIRAVGFFRGLRRGDW